MPEPYVAAPEFDKPRLDPFIGVQPSMPEDPAAMARVNQGDVQLEAVMAEVAAMQPAEAPPYEPTPEDQQLAAHIEQEYQLFRQDRQYHEPQWFMNSAFLRGNQDVTWNSVDNRLTNPQALMPTRAKRHINRIFAKVRTRRAKFLKNRPQWIVIPATNDVKDKLDARATGKVLDYVWRKQKLEAKFRDALSWSETCSRGYWWFGWNPDAIGRVQDVDPMTGKKVIKEAVVGDVTVEAGSPFEVLVDDPGASSLATVCKLIRAKERTLEYITAYYPDRAHLVSADVSGDLQAFQYENQIATLNTTNGIFGGGAADPASRKRNIKGEPNSVVVKEYFYRPNAEYPKGMYAVVANGVLLKKQDELPFGLYDMDNPFPCVEFVDVPGAGQYWGTTVIEQMIDLQKEYNGIRTMVTKQIKVMGHPKILVAKQHQISPGAWTPDEGEIIEYNARPGIPEPTPWIPPNIVADAWRMLDLLRTEFDDVTQIYPAAEGKSTGTESGFHANLLQEAADLVHGPDIRAHEIAIEEAAFKIRRIIKQGYSVPRLVSVTSGAYEPEIFEFSAEDVDDAADIVVQAGSALPTLKGARIQAALDLYAKGVLGNPDDPNVRRRLLNVLDLGGMDDFYEYARVDEDMINIENSEAEDGMPIQPPRFYENHQMHWEGHINKLKSPAVLNWKPEARMQLLAHAILHAKYINHAAAYQMAIEAGMPDLIPPPMMMAMPGLTQAIPPGAPGMGAAPSPEMSFAESPDMTQASGTAEA